MCLVFIRHFPDDISFVRSVVFKRDLTAFKTDLKSVSILLWYGTTQIKNHTGSTQVSQSGISFILYMYRTPCVNDVVWCHSTQPLVYPQLLTLCGVSIFLQVIPELYHTDQEFTSTVIHNSPLRSFFTSSSGTFSWQHF